MPRQYSLPDPTAERQLVALGSRLKNSRIKQNFTTVEFAAKLKVSRDTLNRLEKGESTISLGTYLRALHLLGLESDLDLLARDR